jgi:hypothetical protein
MRLDIAAALEFPNGGVTASSLRCEARARRLDLEKVANKFSSPVGA